MDPWKPIRLWLCVGVMLALLAVGGYARLVWGVPEAPYGYAIRWVSVPNSNKRLGYQGVPKQPNPLAELEAYYLEAADDEIFNRRRNSGGGYAYPIYSGVGRDFLEPNPPPLGP